MIQGALEDVATAVAEKLEDLPGMSDVDKAERRKVVRDMRHVEAAATDQDEVSRLLAPENVVRKALGEFD